MEIQMQDDLKARIVKLSKMTVENGCTESEALAAASKIAKLLDDNGFSMQELKDFENNNKKSDTEYGIFDTGRKNAHEVFWCISRIGEFFDCVSFSQKDRYTKVTSMKFFGFSADVVGAIELTKAIMFAMESDYTLWFENNKHFHGEHGKTLRKSFMLGFASRINARLKELKAARNVQANTGTALIVLKNQIVVRDFQQQKIKIVNKKTTVSTSNTSAYEAGQAAGGRADLYL